MNKETFGKVPSLSCVENYFLAYFQEKRDVRVLYAESYVPPGEVARLLLSGVSYENYPLKRLQDTSECLGLTRHVFQAKLSGFEESGLHLVRVNGRFFEGSKLLPWREDHYVAIGRTAGGYRYLNHYPLSEGRMSEARLLEVYGGACLHFYGLSSFDRRAYAAMCGKQYARLAEEDAAEGKRAGMNIPQLRDAMLIVKTLLKRISAWLEYEAEQNRFDGAPCFRLQTERLAVQCERFVTDLQLQMLRRREDAEGSVERFALLCEQERLWRNEIGKRRR